MGQHIVLGHLEKIPVLLQHGQGVSGQHTSVSQGRIFNDICHWPWGVEPRRPAFLPHACMELNGPLRGAGIAICTMVVKVPRVFIKDLLITDEVRVPVT